MTQGLEALLASTTQDPKAEALARALFATAFPEDIAALGPQDVDRIVELCQQALAAFTPGAPSIVMETADSHAGRRRVALVLVNEDMPFLVDSVAMALAAAQHELHLLLHPVLQDPRGRISLIYIETDRLGARARQELESRLRTILGHVRLAVGDWQAMLAALRTAAAQVAAGAAHQQDAAHKAEWLEASAFLEWLAADHFTLLGHARWQGSGRGMTARMAGGLGLLREDQQEQPATWDGEAGRRRDGKALAPVLVRKSSHVATVHRRAPYDVIVVRHEDAQGHVQFEDRFIGLFTSAALASSPWHVPMVRRKVQDVVAHMGFDARGHSGKAVRHIIDTFPRDGLFAMTSESLAHMVPGLLSLIDRPRAKLFVQGEDGAHVVTIYVHVPRDLYTSHIRERIGHMLEQKLTGALMRYDAELRSDGLARVQYVVLRANPALPMPSQESLDQHLVDLVRGWEEAIEAELVHLVPPARAARLALSHGRGFSDAYRSRFSPREAAFDIAQVSALPDSAARAVHFYRTSADEPHRLRLKIYRNGPVIALSDAVPVLEAFGLRVIEEFPYDIADGRHGWIHDFLLECMECSLPEAHWLESHVAPALQAVLTGSHENDGFNALVLSAGLSADEAGWLRAYFRYMRQTGQSFGIQTAVDALRRYAGVARALVGLFRARFAPDMPDRATRAAQANADIDLLLADVGAIEDDRIIRLYRTLIEATLRTNAFVPGGPEALAFKLDSHQVPDLPDPVPYREIWVYAPRVEGIHLRGGPIARGGLRWSDRRDDFRTEVLGLVKAQMVKNAVIVPTGAKGGFYPKQLPAPSARDAWAAEGAEAYRIYIRALLSITDNIVEDQVVGPDHVVRHDGDDPYLVVAADKGTASFSDVANAISIAKGFWLGDAFASGGSQGYDHKAMAITARGAWISVARHFAEMGVDVQNHAVRVAGVGDMSGDVFGNGMLLSQSIQLVAAFDHRHIFLDPAPDPAKSFAERQRLFAMPRSSWADYDPALISAGGGVYARTQKSIPLSAQVRALLGVEATEMTPTALMQAILRAPVDLLWFGGIGTYVKAEGESDTEVGDRANDAVRITGQEVRARVIGEGANLGVTQRGRIVYAQKGGRINTDFIDNSAGVDCSDHEVNIKIALTPVVRDGRLSMAARNDMLAHMTDDVAALVLRDNIYQTQALSLAQHSGTEGLAEQWRLLNRLEAAGRLNRRVEFLPSNEEIAQRSTAQQGFTRPELAVLLAYAKMALYEALAAAPALCADALCQSDLLAAFPQAMHAAYPDALQSHRLRREIVATKLANQMVNMGGLGFAFDLAEEAGTTLAHVGSAYVAVRALFDLPKLWADIAAADVSLTLRNHILAACAQAMRVQMRDMLRASRPDMGPSHVVTLLRDGLEDLGAALEELLQSEPRAQLAQMAQDFAAAAVPEDLAARILHIFALDGAIGTADLARTLEVDAVAVARAYTHLGQALGLDWAQGSLARLSTQDGWERLLLSDLDHGFEAMRLGLVARITAKGGDPLADVAHWLATHHAEVARFTDILQRVRAQPQAGLAAFAHVAAQARALLRP